ncbi:RNA helicase aquarius-like isoform X2 [Rosa chinensis]|uniref:RNA helicase aquarius-like isoform X2 n=1 Tax=Rosa chinensis TaxID=74649 RepID=UPI001AD8C44D|nr:RNA helicase aquarius-like isoform X2 [Rosa chinensis]
MTKVYGTGAYDFKRHHVAEYPVELNHQLGDKPVVEAKPGAALPSSITLSEIQRDQLTMIAAANWSKAGGDAAQVKKAFDPELVPLQRVMILEVSQYLENYLFPNFYPETATFEHVMSMILIVNENVLPFEIALFTLGHIRFRENVAAWVCFHDRKDAFKGFLGRVLRLKSVCAHFSALTYSLMHHIWAKRC